MNKLITSGELSSHHRGMRLTRIYYSQNEATGRGQKTSRILIIVTDSKYCENVQRFHKGNHVYFVLTESGGLFQKCHCPNDTLEGRVCEIHCKNFMGSKYGHRIPIAIDRAALMTIFPLIAMSMRQSQSMEGDEGDAYSEAKMANLKKFPGALQPMN